jgi:lactobin A/cerein 7B family class IIb bacteriocin
MNTLQEVSRSELEQVEGGAIGVAIAVAGTLAIAIGGAFVLGYVNGATSDECKKQ